MTVLYGFADVAVMAVGGFLLLPLYTHALSQAEFGRYVAVKANTEIFTYLVCLGLPSAVSRLYFDYRKSGEEHAYINSVALFFLLAFALLLLLVAPFAGPLWAELSPATPVMPYLAFSLALAGLGFASTLGSLWLRLEQRARDFALVQVSVAALLTGCAVLNLSVLNLGLPGLLWALVVSGAGGALLLPWLLGRHFRPTIQWRHIRNSLPYAGPSLLGYVGYFLLNRLSTLVLQRHVSLDELAVFGLAQQLAMIVTVAAGALAKAQQPLVFECGPADVDALMQRVARLLRWMMLAITGVLLAFADELVALVAPRGYGSDIHILQILLVANFAMSISQISDTVLLYHRRPGASLAVSLFGALASVGLSLLLVPAYHATGAALAMALTFASMTLLSHVLAWRVSGRSHLLPYLASLLAAIALAALTIWLHAQALPWGVALGLKLSVLAGLAAAVAWRHVRRPHMKAP